MIAIIMIPNLVMAKDKFFIRATTRIVNGRMMCLKSNDKPKLSKKKKWHIDRECCLDYKEIPNPHCYYPPKYQFLINKYNQKYGDRN